MSRKRILVADDAEEMRTLLADYVLGPAGYEVLTAKDGTEGLDLAKRFCPDVLVLDYDMPCLSGVELLNSLKQNGVNVPAILITASGSEALAVRAMRAGFRDYLVKPFSPDALLETVEHMLAAPVPEPNPLPPDASASRVHELKTLGKIAKSLTAQLDLEHVLNSVVEAAVKLTGAEEGSLMLVDEETGELYIRAAKNFDAEMAQSFRLKVADSLAGEAMHHKTPITLSTANALKITTAYLVKDLIYVPLVLESRSIGVLGVDNRFANRSFKRDHVRLLAALADYAVIAIRNARLYAETRYERDTLNAILRNTEGVIMMVDTEDRILVCNPAARRAFKMGDHDLVGYRLKEVVDHEGVLAFFAQPCPSNRRDCVSEITLESERTLYAHMTFIEGVGRAAVMQDITYLKDLDRIKSDFVTTLSHDLRSPLTAILGYVELLSRVGPINEAQTQFIDRIIVSVQSITTLISDLLELGRIEAGFEMDRKPAPMASVIRYALEAKQQTLETHGHDLDVDVPPDLPTILGNPSRLKQMVTNMLDNAIKYTPQGGRIGVRAYAEDESIVVEISDNGIGIPLAEQSRIFEKFYRADNITTQTGTGLGLSIVKSIVEQHKGRVWVDSSEGEGSTFTVLLPANEEPPSP